MIPNFAMGMLGLTLCLLAAKFVFMVPFRGVLLLWCWTAASMLYLFVALGIGLLISSTTKNQFVSSQLTMLITFLPAMMLSGFLFDLRSVPTVVRMITYALPARYFVSLLQTIFLAGDVWEVIIPDVVILAGMAVLLLFLAWRATQKQWAGRTRDLAMYDSFRRIFALTLKELLAVLKDPHSRFSLLIPPIIQCLLYGYVATYDLTDVPYAVLDRDHTAPSHELLAKLDGSGIFHRVDNLQREADIKTFIDERQALLIIQIDQDFERRLMLGQPAGDPGTSRRRPQIPTRPIPRFSTSKRSSSSSNADWARQRTDRATRRSGIATRAWFNPNLETRWNMVPGLIGTLTLLQTLLLTAMSVAREREQQTFDQLMVTPFRPVEVMAGKALPSMLIGFVQATVILLVAQLWFYIPFVGSFFVLYLGLALFLLAAVGIGLVLSCFAHTMQQAMLYSLLLIMPFILLSGLTTPISSMPDGIQFLTLFNPLRYAIDVVHRVYLEGVGLDQLFPELWPLAVMAVVTLSVATWMFHHRI